MYTFANIFLTVFGFLVLLMFYSFDFKKEKIEDFCIMTMCVWCIPKNHQKSGLNFREIRQKSVKGRIYQKYIKKYIKRLSKRYQKYINPISKGYQKAVNRV